MKNKIIPLFFLLLSIANFSIYAGFTECTKYPEDTVINVPDPIEWAKSLIDGKRLDYLQKKIRENPNYLDEEEDFYIRLIKPAQQEWLLNNGWKPKTIIWRDKERKDPTIFLKDDIKIQNLRPTSNTFKINQYTGEVIKDNIRVKKEDLSVSGRSGVSRRSRIYIHGIPASISDGFDISEEETRVLQKKKRAIYDRIFYTKGPNGRLINRKFTPEERKKALAKCKNEQRELHIKTVYGKHSGSNSFYNSLELSAFSKYGTFRISCKSNNGDQKAKVIAVSESLISHVANYVDPADAYLRNKLGLPAAEKNAAEDEEKGANISIIASAENHQQEKDEQYCLDYTPSKIIIKGKVTDDGGQPLNKAKLQLENPAATVKTDEQGNYTLSVSTGKEGDKVWKTTMNFSLTRIVKGLKCALEDTKEPLIANGKKYPITLHVTDDNGQPLKNRKLTVFPLDEWTGPKDIKTDYITLPPTSRYSVQTDENGSVTVDFSTPLVLNNKIGTLIGKKGMDRIIFPVQGILRIVDVKNGEKCEIPYALESPFPQVEKLRIVDVDAGTWQKKGSTLVISDRDSKQFTVEIKALGKLKIAGGPILKNELVYDMNGFSSDFYYYPNLIGEDLNAQPGDLGIEFFNMNMKLIAKYMIDISGSCLLKSVGGQFAEDGYLYDHAKLFLGRVETADKIETLASDMQYTPDGKPSCADIEDKAVQVSDTIIGCVEAVPNLADLPVSDGASFGNAILGVSKYNVPLEVSKIVLENAKLMLKFHRQFEAINNTYQDTIFMPIVVTVKDTEGHKISIMRNISVRAWKK